MKDLTAQTVYPNKESLKQTQLESKHLKYI